MGRVVDMREWAAAHGAPRRRATVAAPAEIHLFLGVRYERTEETPAESPSDYLSPVKPGRRKRRRAS
jgi:hypothetical protein